MKDAVQVETALRLVGERRILNREHHGGWASGLGEIASALVLLCDLPLEVAEAVMDDYAFAQSLRGHGPPPRFRAHRRAAMRNNAAKPTPFTPPVVVGCDTTVDLPDGSAHLGSVVFNDDACHVGVRYDELPTWAGGPARRIRRGARAAHSGPPSLAIADDQGTQTTAHFSGGGSQERWHGRWTTDGPLSPATRWLDFSGIRVELGQQAAPCPVRVEALPDAPLVHRYLWHRLASSDRGPSDETVVDVLVALDVVDPDDPVVQLIAELGEALNVHGGVPPANAPELWKGLFGRRHRDDGPTGDVLLAAATPLFDNTVVVVDDMRSESHGFIIQARAVGDGPTPPPWHAAATNPTRPHP